VIMEAAGADPKMHLKEWLVAQIDSERYDGLRWEVGDNRRLFRIPWKHAAKKDYRLHDDAALFKVDPLRPPENPRDTLTAAGPAP